MKRPLSFLVAYIAFCVPMGAGAQAYSIVNYNEDNGLSHSHVTQMLQDRDGFMWFATWNGLNRFDGYEFVNFKSHPGDGVDMPSDRIRSVLPLPGNATQLVCRVDERWYSFSLHTGRFSPLSSFMQRRMASKPLRSATKSISGNDSLRFGMDDIQGNTWYITDKGIKRQTPVSSPMQIASFAGESDVKWMFLDRHNQLWIASSGDKAVRVISNDGRTVHFLAPDGSLKTSFTPFSSAIYCIYEARNGDVWLGSKPDGLYRLVPHGAKYGVSHYKKSERGLLDGNIYDIKEDATGRIWLATLGGGIACFSEGHFRHFLFGKENKVRRIYLLPGKVLMAATTEGLVTMDISHFTPRIYLNCKEASRASSISSSACMCVLHFRGHYYVATESGGVNEILSDNLLSSHLSFRHFDGRHGLTSDVIQSMAPWGNSILLVSNSQLMTLNPATGETGFFNAHFFRHPFRFSDATPLRMADGRWLFGLKNGVSAISEGEMQKSSYIPHLVLTGIRVENRAPRYTVNHLDTLVLSPEERTLVISFAALDYRDPQNIKYAYKMNDNADWTFLGSQRSISLPELTPGVYRLMIRSTNADGKWVSNNRMLTIIVRPKFVETVWFLILIIFFVVIAMGGAAYTYVYIRSIKRQQHEILDAYLALIEHPGNIGDKTVTSVKTPVIPVSADTKLSPDDENFMSRVMAFVEAHIADSDVNIVDMAEAVATSRSGLNRKMKQIVGLTPADFLREARLKRASQMLQDTTMTVSEIAYACGFSDPKYFGRLFKSSFGMSPSEYRGRGSDDS